MLLGEKSLSDLLRIAFPYTFSEPPTVSASLPRAVKLWGWSREQRSLQGAGSCGTLLGTLPLPGKGTGCRQGWGKGRWFCPIACGVGLKEQFAGADTPGSHTAHGTNLIIIWAFTSQECSELHLASV